MNDKKPTPPIEYRCPGEKSPISRAVHLGRLAAFYPACRECLHREETGSLSPRQVEQLSKTADRRRPRPLFSDEGAGGVYLDRFAPADARRIAAAFGAAMRSGVGELKSEEGEERREEGEERREEGEERREEGGERSEEREEETGGRRNETEQKYPPIHQSSLINHHSPSPQSPAPNPSVLLAGDGRPISAELVASAADGLRWSGCDVIDIGPATAPCLAFTIHHLKAAGGLMVGNPGMASHEVGLQFWTADPRPLSAGDGLERIQRLAETELTRPTRRSGAMSRFQADDPYLAALSEHYHALRPLRVAVHSVSKPTHDYLQRLCANVACRIIPMESPPAANPLPSAAHFAVQIDGDGETCLVFDEQGREVPPNRLLKLLARYIYGGSEMLRLTRSQRRRRLGDADKNTGNRTSSHYAVAVVSGLNECLQSELASLIPSRADVSAAMCASGAPLGFGPGARYWHATGGVPLPDALMTVTWLLKILSRGDEPFSGVLDRDIAKM